MTDVTPRTPRKRLRLTRTMFRVGLLSLALAIAIFGGLSLQMAAGHDPALGPKLEASRAEPVAPGQPRKADPRATVPVSPRKLKPG